MRWTRSPTASPTSTPTRAEDAIINAYRSSIGRTAELAAAYDPDFRGRYSPGSDDWRLVDAKN